MKTIFLGMLLPLIGGAVFCVIVLLTAFNVHAATPCTCLQNARGQCMKLGTGPYPYRQMDEYISGPFCTSGCYPGFSDTYGYSETTMREMTMCHINWVRLRHEMGRDNDPHWQW